jgi:hypothetical protein
MVRSTAFSFPKTKMFDRIREELRMQRSLRPAGEQGRCGRWMRFGYMVLEHDDVAGHGAQQRQGMGLPV